MITTTSLLIIVLVMTKKNLFIQKLFDIQTTYFINRCLNDNHQMYVSRYCHVTLYGFASRHSIENHIDYAIAAYLITRKAV